MRRHGSVHSLAIDLDISVNTLKRLLRKGVFPSDIVQKTPGSHWRIRNPDLQELRARLKLWQFWHRKGLRRPGLRPVYSPKGLCCLEWLPNDSLCMRRLERVKKRTRNGQIKSWESERRVWGREARSEELPNKSTARQDELEKFELDLIQLTRRDYVIVAEDYSKWVEEIKKGSDESIFDNPDALNGLHKLVLESSPEKLAELILQVNVGRFRKEKNRYPNNVAELATYMGIGPATLYRVFGNANLQTFLSPSANLKNITNREEKDQAEDAKDSKTFTFSRDASSDEHFWRESTTS